MGEFIFNRIKEYLLILLKGLIGIIYPREPFCILCRKNETDNVVCSTCMDKIQKCSKDDIAYGYYKGELKMMIFKFKYEKDFNVAEILVEFLLQKINIDRYQGFYITYIPITKESYKKREFNQCEYIAKELERQTGNKVINCLETVRRTRIQKELSKEERIKNMKEVFVVKNINLVYKQKIILIDDVMTTGATINDAKRAIIEAGALEVKQLVLARAEI